ncbi:hypothetical protein GOV14_07140 [Candidatus Pacearchaeota archaeon]|nr:hypothetical protein [Candidatus Pacearchaeota archaeon]
MKKDPYDHEGRYKRWRKVVEKTGIPNISKYNSDLILQYLEDMEYGYNVSKSSSKGGRSYIRLNTLRQKLIFFAKKFKELYGCDKITDVTELQLCQFFVKMSKGIIKRVDGKPYICAGYYVKNFKAFWHWFMKINKKQGIKIKEITEDLDSTQTKPKWVYLTEDQVKLLCQNATYKYRVLIMFLFDSGIRSPTELINIKVSDFYNDFKELCIRDEVSKTFGRRIKLMICSELIKGYVESQGFKENDPIFDISPKKTNQYLRRLALRILGDKESPAGQKYSDLTMYDFRHISTCYWLPRYKSESALKFRFGWKKSDKIHYYSEMLGMRDTINEEDMLVDVTKTEIEKRLMQSENEKDILKERVQSLESQMQKMLQLVNKAVFVVQENGRDL